MWLLIGVCFVFSVTFFVQRLFPSERIERVFRMRDSTPDAISSMTPIPRRNRSISVSIVAVVSSDTSFEQYEIAITSVECYAATHGYPFFVINDTKYANVCDHKDVMFRRHCVVAEFLEATEPGEWLLYIDADIMVVNPNRLIEEWIDQDHDVILYDRFYNWEVAAGSYLVRNSPEALRFLRAFAGYEFRLPPSFHGTDNGALHMLLLEWLLPIDTPEIGLCRSLWRTSTGYADLFRFEACTRMAIGVGGSFPQRRLRIFRKGTAWVRDIWLTSSGWSDDDFMLHGIKAVKEFSDVTAREHVNSWSADDLAYMDTEHFVNPLIGKLDREECAADRVAWRYRDASRITRDERAARLFAMDTYVRRLQLRATGEIAKSQFGWEREREESISAVTKHPR